MTNQKPRVGFIMVGAKRFRPLGEGTADGTYENRKEAEAEKIISQMTDFAEPVFPGIIYEREDVDRAIDIFIQKKVDCVAALFLSWAEDFTWIRFLRELPAIPLFFCSIVRDSLAITDTNDENQFVDFLSAGALVGFQEASGSLVRFNRPMTAGAIGTLDDISEKLRVFALAAKARNILKSSVVGLLSCYNEAMWATYIDPYNLFFKIGPELRFLSVTELVNEISATPDEIINDICKRLTGCYKLLPNVDASKLHESVKATYAMEAIAKKAGIDLLVLNDIDRVLFENVGLRPGFSPLEKNGGLTVVPEGDIGGGLAVYILQLLSGGIANFIEPFYIDRVKGTFSAGHAGPNNYHAHPENVVIARDERFAKTSYKHAGAPFAWTVFAPGLKTLLHMSECSGRVKMVCTLVEALPTEHYLASYSHADFRHTIYSPEELFGKITAHGVTQHYGITAGDWMVHLEHLAKLCDFEFIKI